GASQGVTLERFPSCQHQDDDRSGQVLAQQDRSDDGNASQQIRAEFTLQELLEQFIEERNASESERRQQRKLVCCRTHLEGEAQHEMHENRQDTKSRYDRGLAVPDSAQWFPQPTVRRLMPRLWVCHLRFVVRHRIRGPSLKSAKTYGSVLACRFQSERGSFGGGCRGEIAGRWTKPVAATQLAASHGEPSRSRGPDLGNCIQATSLDSSSGEVT